MTFFSIYMNKWIIKFNKLICPFLCISLPHTDLNSICWSYCAVVGQHCHSGFLVSAATFLCAVTSSPPLPPAPDCGGHMMDMSVYVYFPPIRHWLAVAGFDCMVMFSSIVVLLYLDTNTNIARWEAQGSRLIAPTFCIRFLTFILTFRI